MEQESAAGLFVQSDSVLDSAQSGGEVRQLGLIFFSEADAHALVQKV